MSSKLQDTLELIEESLDVALSRTATSFDEDHYSKVQLAYQLLGKTQVISIGNIQCWLNHSFILLFIFYVYLVLCGVGLELHHVVRGD